MGWNTVAEGDSRNVPKQLPITPGREHRLTIALPSALPPLVQSAVRAAVRHASSTAQVQFSNSAIVVTFTG